MPNSEEDVEMYLKKHLEQNTTQNTAQNNNQPVLQPKRIVVDNNVKMSDLDYTNYNASDLPCSSFYPEGTILMVKGATTKSIQKFSTINENDFLASVEGVKDMLMSCVKIKYADGTIVSALGIKELDKLYILYLIRNLTPLSKRYLTTKKECSCKCMNEIEHTENNFVYYKISPKMMQHFDVNSRSFNFNYKGGAYKLTCPNVGLTLCVYRYLAEQIKNNKDTNLAFIKIIPYTLGFKNSITDDEIKIELDKFENISTYTFDFLNSAVTRLLYGVEGLSKKCSNPECDLDVYVDTITAFPKKLSDIFLDDDAFEDYLNAQ